MSAHFWARSALEKLILEGTLSDDKAARRVLMTALLETRDLTRTFGAVVAAYNINIEIQLTC